MRISWRKYTLPLEPFTISKGTFHERNCLIIKLEQDNFYGLGEATEISYYDISLDIFIEILELNLVELSAIKLEEPSSYFIRIRTIIGDHPFILSAFDCAAHDLFGKIKGRPTRDLISLKNPKKNLPLTSFTIGLGNPQEMATKIKKHPWPIYKIKLGGDQDLETMKAIRQCSIGTIRVDANEGWKGDTADYLTKELEKLHIELVEQPLPRSENSLMPELKRRNQMIFLADESCQTIADVEACSVGFDGINIKLMKCGGITPAIKMIETARALNLLVMIGCMTESSIGISAAAQLIPWVDYVDLDGAMLLKADIAKGVTFRKGEVKYIADPGHGCQLIPRRTSF